MPDNDSPVNEAAITECFERVILAVQAQDMDKTNKK